MNNLSGSEKQIAWAEDIRDTFLNGIVRHGQMVDQGINQMIESSTESMNHYSAKCDRKGVDKETHLGFCSARKNIKLFIELKNKIENESSAKWFIDNNVNNHILFTKHVYNK